MLALRSIFSLIFMFITQAHLRVMQWPVTQKRSEQRVSFFLHWQHLHVKVYTHVSESPWLYVCVKPLHTAALHLPAGHQTTQAAAAGKKWTECSKEERRREDESQTVRQDIRLTRPKASSVQHLPFPAPEPTPSFLVSPLHAAGKATHDYPSVLLTERPRYEVSGWKNKKSWRTCTYGTSRHSEGIVLNASTSSFFSGSHSHLLSPPSSHFFFSRSSFCN